MRSVPGGNLMGFGQSILAPCAYPEVSSLELLMLPSELVQIVSGAGLTMKALPLQVKHSAPSMVGCHGCWCFEVLSRSPQSPNCVLQGWHLITDGWGAQLGDGLCSSAVTTYLKQHHNLCASSYTAILSG